MANISKIKLPSGVTYDVVDNTSGYITSYIDTKNTAGSTNSTSKLYLIGATEQSANPQTYSNSNLVYYNGLKSTSSTNQSGNYTSIDQNGDSIVISSTDYYFSVGEDGVEITDEVYNTISLTSNGVEIHGLLTPTNNTDAANKKYVDDSIAAIPTNWLNGSATGSVRTSGSTAEDSNYTIGNYAVAEGQNTKASGNYSHAEGRETTASSADSHAEGLYTTASAIAAHSEGSNTIASGTYSHASGWYTTAQRRSQTVIGEYNVLDTAGNYGSVRGNYAFIIGNGSSSARSNALAVKWDGTVETAKGNLSGVQIVRW